jgi:hypothetical protein
MGDPNGKDRLSRGLVLTTKLLARLLKHPKVQSLMKLRQLDEERVEYCMNITDTVHRFSHSQSSEAQSSST